jgi:hypothetical protein
MMARCSVYMCMEEAISVYCTNEEGRTFGVCAKHVREANQHMRAVEGDVDRKYRLGVCASEGCDNRQSSYNIWCLSHQPRMSMPIPLKTLIEHNRDVQRDVGIDLSAGVRCVACGMELIYSHSAWKNATAVPTAPLIRKSVTCPWCDWEGTKLDPNPDYKSKGAHAPSPVPQPD